MTKRSIRIKGLVSLMNHAREQLTLGIPAGDADNFRAMVQDGVRTVETICRQNHITPDDLPAPSRRAYSYLKNLDLEHLPLRTTAAPAVPKTIRLTNVITTCKRYHAEFTRLTTVKNPPPWHVEQPDIVRLAKQLRSDDAAIAALCHEEGGTPANLPVQSRRGYQWLAFLGDPENLVLHLTSLAHAYRTAKTGAARAMLPLAQKRMPVYIEFYATAVLYRTHSREDGTHITANEGFIGAPRPVIKALVYTALSNKKGDVAADVKAYARSEVFEEVTVALELTTAELSDNTQGQHVDLAAVFDRVNATYFGGTLPRPHLTWNRTLTHRKFGHYQFTTDTVMISVSLDDAQVPSYAVDFVMYHELLHKQLGVKVVNGRRYAHTPAFREAERAFARYDDAQKALARLSTQHRR